VQLAIALPGSVEADAELLNFDAVLQSQGQRFSSKRAAFSLKIAQMPLLFIKKPCLSGVLVYH
jgi:hypothetical protein